jgi:DNA-binding response OmpR family regulator
LGYDVDVAYDGFSALVRVKQKSYDIALLDLKMPGMDGLELFKRIKEVSRGTVAIVVTAYASSETADRILNAGAWQIMPKPVDFSALLGLVNEALDQPLVLVVDDDHELCDTLWHLFREQGLRVHIAHDVGAANDRLQNHRFHVVLIDFKLPSGTGVDVFRSLQQHNPQARAIFITGCRNEADLAIRQALDQGADAVCHKPFNVPELLELTRRLAHRDAQA